MGKGGRLEPILKQRAYKRPFLPMFFSWYCAVLSGEKRDLAFLLEGDLVAADLIGWEIDDYGSRQEHRKESDNVEEYS
jgi:hypothetical protein